MSNNYSNVLAEANFVLQHSEIKSKIPNEILEKINKYKNNDYEVTYDNNKTIYEQKFNKQTFKLLSIIYLKYCVSKQKRKELLTIKKINYEKKQEKYNVDNIFKTKKSEKLKENKQVNENMQIIKNKETIMDKMKKFIKKMFNKG